MKIVLPDDAIEEVGARRLQYMDAAGISKQVLSYGAGSPQNIADVGLAAELCREANEAIAKLIQAHPTRFAGFALLPVTNAEKAAEELTYSVQQLGLKGAMISGTYNGTFFDEPQFLPLFAKAQELGVPIFMHPAIINNKPIVDYYFNSPQWSAVAGAMFATAGFGWHADAGIALIRMIISGLFDKLPNLQIISGHWGELVPFYLNRLDDQLQKTLTIERKISDYFKRNIYISPSGFFDAHQLTYAVNTVGADRILFACDYPFLIDNNAKQFLEEAPISAADKRKIAYENAEKLLKI
ncbi:MAG: amidohydrolase family protein [Capnocytophaga sp.]|nr:amidohydrolase family protein [Capnocytophaga sp.]